VKNVVLDKGQRLVIMAPLTLEDIVLLEMTIRGRVVIPKNSLEYQTQVQKNHNAGFHHHKPAMVCRILKCALDECV
jgi:hypothetical protein